MTGVLVQNIRKVDYPTDRMEVIIIFDGSSDRTNAIFGSLQRHGNANSLYRCIFRDQPAIWEWVV